MSIQYIVRAYTSTGQIRVIQPPPPNSPPEGAVSGTDETIVYINQDFTFPSDATTIVEFQEKYYRNFQNSTWVALPERPNNLATWNGTSWVTDNEAWLTAIRLNRNFKLVQSDWTQLLDNSLTAEQRTEAQTYRAELRDVPGVVSADIDNYKTEASIPWPTPPTFLA